MRDKDSNGLNDIPLVKLDHCGTKGDTKMPTREKATVVALFAIIEIFSLVLWQKAEDFSGFTARFVHWLSECGFLAGIAYLAYQFTRNHKIIWFTYALACTALFFTKAVGPKQNEHPFAIELEMGDPLNSRDSVKLTNDFLFYRLGVHRVLGDVFAPIKEGESNAELSFSIKNNSDKLAENIQVFFFSPKSANCITNPRWYPAEPDKLVSGSIGKSGTLSTTNEMQIFGFDAPNALYPNDTGTFPIVKLSQQPYPYVVGLIVKSKDMPGEGINFNLFFLQNSFFSSNDFHRPFLLYETNFNELMKMPISPKILEDLQK